MSRTKKIFAAAVVAACLSLSAAGTLAYFTDEGRAHNVITSGSVSVELQELRQNEDGTFSEFEDVVGVMPGASVSKIVQVANDGFGDAYVRVRVDSSIVLANGRLVSAGDVERYLHIAFDEDSWMYSDGWWYYVAPDAYGTPGLLAPSVVTAPLFESVSFDSSMPNEYQSSTATIKVTVQAVQSANNGDDPVMASGWPSDDE